MADGSGCIASARVGSRQSFKAQVNSLGFFIFDVHSICISFHKMQFNRSIAGSRNARRCLMPNTRTLLIGRLILSFAITYKLTKLAFHFRNYLVPEHKS